MFIYLYIMLRTRREWLYPIKIRLCDKLNIKLVSCIRILNLGINSPNDDKNQQQNYYIEHHGGTLKHCVCASSVMNSAMTSNCNLASKFSLQQETTASIPNLHSDKGHKILFAGGSNTHKRNPRWQTAAILEKSINGHCLRVI